MATYRDELAAAHASIQALRAALAEQDEELASARAKLTEYEVVAGSLKEELRERAARSRTGRFLRAAASIGAAALIVGAIASGLASTSHARHEQVGCPSTL